MSFPILYSFRRCPYAMRARLAILLGKKVVQLREVVLKDKPEALTRISLKATVPVLQFSSGQIIEESLEIMLWALQQHAIWQALDTDQRKQSLLLIEHNDISFKNALDHYKYADRYPQKSAAEYRAEGEIYLEILEQRLTQSEGLGLVANELTLADFAILPFVRQFAFVDMAWLESSPYPAVRNWLQAFLNSEVFLQIMHKYPQWQENDEIRLFPGQV